MQSKDRSWVPGSKINLASVSQKIICDALKPHYPPEISGK